MLTVLMPENFSPDIEVHFPEKSFYAGEDTGVLKEAITETLKLFSGSNVTLIDVCSGDAKVPAKFLLEGTVQQGWALDIQTEYATQISEAVNKILSIQGQDKELHVAEYDLLKNNPKDFLKRLVNQKQPIVVSANPPWEPVPDFIENFLKKNNDQAKSSQEQSQLNEFLHEFKDKPEILPSICGGKNGLKFVEPIIRFAKSVDAKKININLPSIADLKDFSEILIQNKLGIEFVHALDSYSYGFDATPSIRKHYTGKIQNNAYRTDEEGKFRYLVMNIRLSPCKKTSQIKASLTKFKEFIEAYKGITTSDNGYEKFVKENGSFCKAMNLSEKDRKRILKELD